jgi:tRNA dimethylallyltransferase
MARKAKGKIIVIVGPNASGKSDLALKIAKKVNGEIISADSRQVYRGMDIGTGKITRKEMLGVPHHLLDIASPKSDFNVSHFKKSAQKKIVEITKRGKVPIIVGGTGFWIDALIYDWPIPEVGPNRALRARLEKLTAMQLFARLQKIDTGHAKNIDHHNKRRLIRALEIAATTGKPVPEFNFAYKYNHVNKQHEIGGQEYGFLVLGLKLPQKELVRKIHSRLLKWLKTGMLKEIKKLHRSGVSWKRLDSFGLEYRYGSRYLHNLISYDEMVDQTYRAIRKYAKRQMTWFKRNPQIHWIKNQNEATGLLKKLF